MRAIQLRLGWQWAFVFTDGDPIVTRPRLAWHHTEFGRRSACEQFRIVHHPTAGWALLDAEWNPLATSSTVAGAQDRAEQIAARAAAAQNQRDPNP